MNYGLMTVLCSYDTADLQVERLGSGLIESHLPSKAEGEAREVGNVRTATRR